MLENGAELLNREYVRELYRQCDSADKLINVGVCVADWEKGNVDLLEDAALNQPTEIGEHDRVFVLSNAIVELDIERTGETTAQYLFCEENPERHLECHVGI